jgi:hypothetical protein
MKQLLENKHGFPPVIQIMFARGRLLKDTTRVKKLMFRPDGFILLYFVSYPLRHRLELAPAVLC